MVDMFQMRTLQSAPPARCRASAGRERAAGARLAGGGGDGGAHTLASSCQPGAVRADVQREDGALFGAMRNELGLVDCSVRHPATPAPPHAHPSRGDHRRELPVSFNRDFPRLRSGGCLCRRGDNFSGNAKGGVEQGPPRGQGGEREDLGRAPQPLPS
jgi:hypothetical protein